MANKMTCKHVNCQIYLLCLLLMLTINGSNGCVQFLKNEKLLIPEGEKCVLESHETWSSTLISLLKIEGVMEIKDDSSIHLRFQKMEISQKGMLLIGNGRGISNNLITLEEVGGSECSFDPNETPGNLSARGQSHDIFTIVENAQAGDDKIRVNKLPLNLTPFQELLLVNYGELISQEVVTVKSIHQKDIHLTQPLKNDYLIRNIQNKQIFPAAASLSRRQSGIILKKQANFNTNTIPDLQIFDFCSICLKAWVIEITGVNFISSKGLDLRGKEMRGNLFSGVNKFPFSRIFQLDADLFNNIFTREEDFSLIQNEARLQENTFFFEVIQAIVSLWTKCRNQIIIKSDLSLKMYVEFQHFFEISRSVFQDSQIKVLNPTDLLLEINDSFVCSTQFSLSEKLKQLTLFSSSWIGTSLDLSRVHISSSLKVFKSHFLGNGNIDHCIIMGSQPILEDQFTVKEIRSTKQSFKGVQINFEESIFSGFKRTIITSTNNLQKAPSQLTSILLNACQYQIAFLDNTINEYARIDDELELPLLNLSQMQVWDYSKKTNSISDSDNEDDNDDDNEDCCRAIVIERQCLHNELLRKPRFNLLNKHSFLIEQVPSYFMLQNIVLADKHQSTDSLMLAIETSYGQVFQRDVNSPSQILLGQIFKIFIQSKGQTHHQPQDKSLDIEEFEILIFHEPNNSMVPGKFHTLIFENQQRAITEAIIEEIEPQNQESYMRRSQFLGQSQNSVTFQSPETQNHLQISWQNIKDDQIAHYKIKFSLCQPGMKKSINNSCVDSCSQQQSLGEKKPFVKYSSSQIQTSTGDNLLTGNVVPYEKSSDKPDNTFSKVLVPVVYTVGQVCTEVCEEGLYLKDQQCRKCPLGCKSCSDSNSCSMCQPNLNMLNGHCVGTCNQSTVAIEGICQPCIVGCQSCRNQNECSQCMSSNSDSLCNSCSENSFQFYGICVPCSESCKSCTGQSEFECTACSEGYTMKDSACIKSSSLQRGFGVCDQGKVKIHQGVCRDCPEGCLDCEIIVKSSSSIMVCLECKQGYYSLSDSQYLDCKKCQKGYFSLQRYCERCHVGCDEEASCYGPSRFQCHKCAKGYFQNSGNGECLACSEECEECEGSAGNCTTCPPSQTMVNFECLMRCPEGTFQKRINNRNFCHPCDLTKCLTCILEAQFCLQCLDGFVLMNGQCFSECKPGYFRDANDYCMPCNSAKCLECAGDDSTCMKCNEGRYLYNYQCIESCPPQGFFINDQGHCQRCDQMCSTCVETPNRCTSCNFPLSLDVDQCVQECPPGKYPAMSIFGKQHCLLCGSSLCQQCSQTSSTCKSCIKGKYLLGETCVESCPNGYFQDETRSKCYKCGDKNCLQCPSGMFQCEKCKHNLLIQFGFCNEKCEAGYFIENEQDKVCKECDQRFCKECEGDKNYCTTCFPHHYYLGHGVCSTQCPRDTFPSHENHAFTCKQCHLSCKKGCIGSNETDCIEAIMMINQENEKAILIAILLPCSIAAVLAIIYGVRFVVKKRKIKQKYSAPPTLNRANSGTSDNHTLVQLERIDSDKQDKHN